MSWIGDLYLTYENNKEVVAKDLESKAVLLPIAHSTQKAQVEVTISEKGEFLRANSINKDEALTIIPVTEDSGSRGNGNNPHPLEDKLEYIAGDYVKFTGIDNTDKYKKYLNLLTQWSHSKYSCHPVRAIEHYISKACVIQDLILAKVLEEENGRLKDSKIDGILQKDIFIRFSVQPLSVKELGNEMAVYKNTEVFNSYVQYYVNSQQKLDLCYISGKVIPCSNKHPSKIRYSGDKAKLISANDSLGFTYRGRFSNSSQVASIGYETSQKAHNALSWLINKQGFKIGEMVIVAWELTGKNIISPTSDLADELFEETEEVSTFTNESYAKKLEKATYGYKQDLNTHSNVVVLGLEAATTGRLSVSFYKKIMGSEFIDKILYWHSTCFWRHRYKKNKDNSKYEWFIGAPAPKDIAITAFGSKNEKLLKATIERILPCIIEGRNIPKDIVKSAIRRVSNRNGFENNYEFSKAVSITCALIKKSQNDYERKEWEMALDRTSTDRSYVYGRLLGAAQKLEEVALFYSNEGSRMTAAERFSHQFVRKPGKTWKIINDQLRPYIAKLKAIKKTWYIKELQEIYDLISQEDFMKQEPLSEIYLLGYNCQLNSYEKNNTDITNEKENE